MITVQEARTLIQQSIQPLGTECVAIADAYQRITAETIHAPFALPRFTNAAMDGFTVRWDDIAQASDTTPITLTVLEMIAAGSEPTATVTQGYCSAIMTGAPMPQGADTVVPFEQTSGFGSNSVTIFKAPKRQANVRYAGEEVSEEEVLVGCGVALNPAAISVIASFGVAQVKVRRQPRIGIITVGDEVQLPGKKLEGAQIYNCNRFMLDAACRSLGIIPTYIHHAPDNREALRQSLSMALTMCDMLITAGGISTGEFDFVQSELTALGINKHFWSIAQKPGKPLYFGTSHEGKAVFALPGNPISAIVCFAAYVIDALALMQGKTLTNPRFTATLAEPFPTDKKRYRFLPAMVWVDQGKLFCKAADKVESHMITSLSGANCLLEAEAASLERSAGELITCTMLPWGRL